jgi:hypothetical protein
LHFAVNRGGKKMMSFLKSFLALAALFTMKCASAPASGFGEVMKDSKKRTVGLHTLAGSLFVFPLKRILCCVERTGG